MGDKINEIDAYPKRFTAVRQPAENDFGYQNIETRKRGARYVKCWLVNSEKLKKKKQVTNGLNGNSIVVVCCSRSDYSMRRSVVSLWNAKKSGNLAYNNNGKTGRKISVATRRENIFNFPILLQTSYIQPVEI